MRDCRTLLYFGPQGQDPVEMLSRVINTYLSMRISTVGLVLCNCLCVCTEAAAVDQSWFSLS